MADSSKVPYLQSYGNITKALERIQSAATPDKFTQDFLSAKLDLSGGSARPLVPYFKRSGFLASDGTPTALYKQFKNEGAAGGAAAQGMRNAYSALYQVNEYAHDLKDDKLKGVILQVTGLEADSKLVTAMIGSFKAFRAFANFDHQAPEATGIPDLGSTSDESSGDGVSADALAAPSAGIRLGYTINLNLPATTDITVFNAIFKSLKEHLL